MVTQLYNSLFFRLSGIRLADFDALVVKLHPMWLCRETRRLSGKGRLRAIGGGMKYRLTFSEQLLLCLIYYRTCTSHVFMALVFGVSAPTVCRHVRAMTGLMAGHFRLPERKVKLSEDGKEDLLHLMIDGTGRPVHRLKNPQNAKQNTRGKRNTTPYRTRLSPTATSAFWPLDPPRTGANMTSVSMTRPV